jgi:hypothetical protein
MLLPASRAERVARRMALAVADAKDGTAMATGLGLPMPRDLDERVAEMKALAHTAGWEGPLPDARVTGIVRSVDNMGLHAIGPLSAWRVCSGFAHGRMWSTLSILEREVFESDDPSVAVLRITNRLDRVLWAVTASHDLLVQLLRLYELRAISPHALERRV